MSAQRCDSTQRPPLQLLRVVAELDRHGIDYVLTGSIVLVAYGADLIPNDLDVTPALDEANLQRLGVLLDDLGAIPAHDADWAEGPSANECQAWTSRPTSEANLDHLFVTRFGLIDVVPRLCGTYVELLHASGTVFVDGHRVRICDPAEVLKRLDGRTRRKDVDRRAQYSAVAEDLHTLPAPSRLQRLVGTRHPLDRA
jgi:hypothetical protein